MPADARLRLEPFRGIRYRPDMDLAAVTSPPYDVLDPAAVAALTAAEPHNLVRLVLPQGPDPQRRNAAARATLDRWLADGTLVVDAEPALYVYEIAAADRVLLRGLIGAVGLDPGAVLPHEDVMGPTVADRAALQEALEAQVEPIWLIYRGGGPAGALVDRVAGWEQAIRCVTADGLAHRLWTVADPTDIRNAQADLARRRAVIADGHHRWTAYGDLAAHRRRNGEDPGAWDLGLALLVDTVTHPPEVAAIHRVVQGVAPAELVVPGVVAEPFVDWTAQLGSLREGTLLVVGPGGSGLALRLPVDRRKMFAGTDGQDRPQRWQALDCAALHSVLLPAAAVAEESVSYHHDPVAAVAAAAVDGGVAVLLAPVDIEAALALASSGIRLPRKSTSFGPKPRGGFVLRSLTL